MGVALFLISIVGLVLRIYELDAKSFWLDEGYTYRATSKSVWALLSTREIANSVQPPLYHILLRFWTACFGESEIAFRSLAVVFGTIAIPFTGLIGKELCDRRTGLLAACLIAVMVFPIWYSQEARNYAFFLAATTSSFYFYVRALRNGGRHLWVGYVLCTLVMLYSHYYALFLCLAQNLHAVWFYRHHTTVMRNWRQAQLFVVVGFAPWLIGFLRDIYDTLYANPGIIGFIPRPTPATLVELLRGYVAFWTHPWWLWLFVALAMLGLIPVTAARPASSQPKKPRQLRIGQFRRWHLKLDDPERTALLLLWLSCPILIPFVLSLFIKPFLWPRYTIAAVPAFYILIAWGVRRLPAPTLQTLALVLIAVASALSLRNYYALPVALENPWKRNYPHYHIAAWREWVSLLRQQVRADDLVLLTPGWQRYPFEYYARDEIAFRVPTSLPTAKNRAEFERSFRELTRDKKRVWMVACGDERAVLRRWLQKRYHQRPLDAPASLQLVPEVKLFDLTQPKQPPVATVKLLQSS